MLLLLATALAAEHTVVREGETIESIAELLGDPALAPVLREQNGLEAAQQPETGAILVLPDSGDAVEQDALVLVSNGAGQLTAPDGAVTPLSEGMAVGPGTQVCTGPESYATLRLAAAADGSGHDDLVLLSDTCVVMDTLTSTASTRSSLVTVLSGGVRVRGLGERDESSRVTVRTASGVTTGRGGSQRVWVEDNASRTESLSGDVSLIGAGKEVVIKGGQGSRVQTGAAPSDPIDLLRPGELLRPLADETLWSPSFTWAPVDRALAYRLELASTPDFDEVVYADELPFAEWRPEALLLSYRQPGLFWRVSAMDRTGFVGLPSTPRAFTLPAFPVGAKPAE